MEEKMPSWINFDLRLQASAANTPPQWLTQSSLFNHPPQHPLPPQQQQQLQQRHPSETLTLAAAATAANNNSHNNTKQFPQGVPLRAGSQFLADLHSDTANSDLIEDDPAMAAAAAAEAETNQIWRAARIKAEILAHPLCEQLLAAHVACLRIATPVNQLPSIDNQLANFHQVVARYSLLATSNTNLTEADEKDELDQFMTHYVLLLWSFKEHLQQHMQVHVMEAVMACCELEQSLLAITGVAPGEGTGETMSDDDDEDALDDEESGGFYDLGVQDGNESTGAYGAYGPLVPTETERSLMERVRQELKVQLKNGYKDRIVDVREEILRKRRAGKLPGDTTTVLKSWWDAHSKWPYPTEDEKSRLVQETGLHLKQINNWFINQRKRNWHSNPSAPLKNKRKR